MVNPKFKPQRLYSVYWLICSLCGKCNLLGSFM